MYNSQLFFVENPINRYSISPRQHLKGASGGGTYIYENVTDTLAGGTYKEQLVLP